MNDHEFWCDYAGHSCYKQPLGSYQASPAPSKIGYRWGVFMGMTKLTDGRIFLGGGLNDNSKCSYKFLFMKS